VAFETQLRVSPDNNQLHFARGLALAYLGQRAGAVHEGERGLALALATRDEYFNIPIAHHLLAQLYVVVGDQPCALDQLDVLLTTPYFVSGAWLRIDPTWATLKGDPRFERLLAQH
jgi:hypothetical protein